MLRKQEDLMQRLENIREQFDYKESAQSLINDLYGFSGQEYLVTSYERFEQPIEYQGGHLIAQGTALDQNQKVLLMEIIVHYREGMEMQQGNESKYTIVLSRFNEGMESFGECPSMMICIELPDF